MVHNQKHNHISNLGILYACNIGGNKMKQKTKPLNLEDLEKEIYTLIKKHIRKNYNPKDFADEWIEVFEDFETMDSELGIIEFIIKQIKQRIKSACNFYLRYKDKPILFQKEQVEYLNVKIISIIEQMKNIDLEIDKFGDLLNQYNDCLLYTSPSPRDRQKSRMPSSA